MGRKESELSNDTTSAVIQSLESPKFRYRTVDAIVAELNLSPATVRRTLVQLENQLVARLARTAEGDKVVVYTTRRHHFGNMSVWEKLSSAFRNRA